MITVAEQNQSTQESQAGSSPQDLITTRELAKYLRLNERTVLKLAAQGELPGVRLGTQWRFRRSVVDTWLDDQMLGVRRSRSRDAGDRVPTFGFEEVFGAAHILPDLRSTSGPRALEELAGHVAKLGLVRDKTWFLGALLEREHVLSSGVGDGVAFPHTLERHPEQIPEPFLLFARSHAGLDFDAPDRKPVHLIVLMGLRYQELHLPWLARLSTALREEALRRQLMRAEGAEAIYEILQERLGTSIDGSG